jgi:hypothetical protein
MPVPGPTTPVIEYAPGTWGPEEVNELIAPHEKCIIYEQGV